MIVGLGQQEKSKRNPLDLFGKAGVCRLIGDGPWLAQKGPCRRGACRNRGRFLSVVLYRSGARYEKNASFSAWLMRRIGARGSFAARTGLRTRPLAMRVEPSDTSTAGAGEAVGGGGG